MTYTTTAVVQQVTPTQAQAWLAECAYPHQRKLRAWHVRELANEMRKGRFIPAAPIAIAHTADGKSHIVNGQHTLNAIIEYGEPVTQIVAHYNGVTEEDVAIIYSHYDINARRSISDALKAHGVDAATGLSPTQQNILGGALQVLYNNFMPASGQERMPREDVAMAMIEWAHEMRLWWQLGDGTRITHTAYRRAAVCAVAIVIMRYAPANMTDDFWSQVANDDGLSRYDPRKLLREFLIDVRVNVGRVYSKTAQTWQMSRVVARAWNAWCDGEDIRLLKLPQTPQKIVIRHTPYDGTL